MSLFHVALASDWEAARAAGAYTTSTRGRTLAEEGFIHLSRAEQWRGVLERFYTDVAAPLVLLEVDPARLTDPLVDEEPFPGAGETYPHLYGPLPVAAVTAVTPLAVD